MVKLASFLLVTALCAVHVSAQASSNYSFPDCANGPLANNTVCDTSADAITRAKALIDLLTPEEMISNMDNLAPGVGRLGLPLYNWWSEALHGIAFNSPTTPFAPSGNFSYATSFPEPILMAAAFDDDLIKAVATVIGTETRAFNNAGLAGLSYFTPNTNPFRDPRWGRGLETPGEDPYRISQYVYNFVDGFQGGIDPKVFKNIADCKHYAGYDLEAWEGFDRHSYSANISQRDLSEYYLPPFQSCVRDAKVGSVMCSYNAVNGIPTCAHTYLLQTILRDYWGFDEQRWVTGDCGAVGDLVTHGYAANDVEAAAYALKAGTDVDCGTVFANNLGAALNQSLVKVSDISKALTRQYASLVRAGYFDPSASQPYRNLGWDDVNTQEAQELAYRAAVDGMALLKNDGTLPLSPSIKSLALIGPWTNMSYYQLGNYFGIPPYVITPLAAAQTAGYTVTFVNGTTANGTDTSGFAEALALAQSVDAVIFAGGLEALYNQSTEAEGFDRYAIGWPGNQQDLILELAGVGKPLIVLQFGGGQIDDAALKHNASVNAILWGGYPGQSGGTAIMDILTGRVAPAGRIPTTQYPADYVDQVSMTDMSLRPSSTNPGRTYKWYTGTPTYEFGYGLHYTTFNLSFSKAPAASYDIQALVEAGRSAAHLDLAPFDTFTVTVHNTGNVTSDYVTLLFVNTTAGPPPFPNKKLVSYTRIKAVPSGSKGSAKLAVTLGSIARVDEDGSSWLYPGTYRLSVDTVGALTHSFQLTGTKARITHWPSDNSTNATAL